MQLHSIGIEKGERTRGENDKKKSYREKKDLLKKAPESGVRIIPKQT